MVRKPSNPRFAFLRYSGIPVIALVGALSACGGDDAKPSATASDSAAADTRNSALSAGTEAFNNAPTSQFDAVRLANQATFGPNEALVSEIRQKGPAKWVKEQMGLSHSSYTSGGTNEVHKNVNGVSYCAQGAQANNPNCWRDYLSTDPLARDFYRNATTQPDQLRQRAALALQHIVVVSGLQVDGTYGFRNYYNGLLERALGNYRDVLRMAILSPVMGDFQNHVNNDKTSPNENIGRELLQLFSIGTCQLNPNGTLAGDKCRPTYNNDTVRNYAYALTGWTYPPGGSADWACQPAGSNCKFYGGDMVERQVLRDTAQRKLLSGVVVPANATAPQALDKVLDSLMQHPNIGPFIAERFIQHFVSSNPHRGYVIRVARAFDTGTFTHSEGGTTYTFGDGKKGDLAATVAATLLDEQARSEGWVRPDSGFLRQPALQFTGAIRALNGITDGATLGWWWGEQLREHLFRPPTVFSFYPSTYPVAGSGTLVGPEFGIHNANGALERLNFLTYLLDWGGSAPDPTIQRATGTKVNLNSFKASADDPAALVDRMSQLVLGRNLEPATRQSVIDSVAFWSAQNKPDDWRDLRVNEAAYLVLASPDYQIQR
jgi:uncharacterized protein (DUF1800 family)